MSTGDGDPAPPEVARPSLAAIATTFGRVSATTFGGGQMAAIRREVVRRRAWLSESEFLELLSIAQILPGANPPNMAVMIGSRLRGLPGAAAGLAASVIPGFAILMAIALLALDVHLPALTGALRGCAAVLPGFAILMAIAAVAIDVHSAALTGALRACAAVAVGLTCANAIELTLPRRKSVVDLVLIAAVAAFVLVLHASLALTLAVFVPIALVATRPRAS